MSEIVLRLDAVEARALWHAVCTAGQLMDHVGEIPRDAPLYGQRDRIVEIARRLDHEINHAADGVRAGDDA